MSDENKTAVSLLAKLADAQKEFELLHESLTKMTDSVIPQEVKQAISEIQEEFSPQLKAAEESMKLLEAEVRKAVIEEGKTVKGLRLQAVFISGKPKWDNSKLEGYAASHPEVLSLRTIGEPTVQIRKIGKPNETAQ